MSAYFPRWQHDVDTTTPHGFLGMCKVTLSDEREFVGDLWRTPGGWLELVLEGDEPVVLAWVAAVGILALNEQQQREAAARRVREGTQRRAPVRVKPKPPMTGTMPDGELLLLS